MNNKIYQPHTSSLGNMNASTAVLLACLALMIFNFWGFVFCCVVIAIERKSGFVKFAVTQVALVWAAFAVLITLLNIINGTFGLLSYWLMGYRGGFLGVIISLLQTARFILLIVLAAKGIKWEEIRVPMLANIADTISHTGAPVLYNGEGPVPPECQVGTPHRNNQGWQQGQPGQNWQQPGSQPYNNGQPNPGQPYGDQAYQNQTPPGQGYGQQPGYGQPVPPSQPAQPAQPMQPAQPTQPAQPGQDQQAPGGQSYTAQPQPTAPQAPPPGSPYSDPNQQLPPEMRDAPPKDMQ